MATSFNPNVLAMLYNSLSPKSGQLAQFAPQGAGGMNPNLAAKLVALGILPKHTNMRGQLVLPQKPKASALDNQQFPGLDAGKAMQRPESDQSQYGRPRFGMSPVDGNWHPNARMPRGFDPRHPNVVGGIPKEPIAGPAEIARHRKINNERAEKLFGGPPSFSQPTPSATPAAPSPSSTYQVPKAWQGVTTQGWNANRAQAPQSALLPPPKLGNRAGMSEGASFMGPRPSAPAQAYGDMSKFGGDFLASLRKGISGQMGSVQAQTPALPVPAPQVKPSGGMPTMTESWARLNRPMGGPGTPSAPVSLSDILDKLGQGINKTGSALVHDVNNPNAPSRLGEVLPQVVPQMPWLDSLGRGIKRGGAATARGLVPGYKRTAAGQRY